MSAALFRRDGVVRVVLRPGSGNVVGLHNKCRCGHAAQAHLAATCVHDIAAWSWWEDGRLVSAPPPPDMFDVTADHCPGFTWPLPSPQAWPWPTSDDYQVAS